ncbi:hypothetical protein [Amycolatopsis sp. NPDC004079]|uniref:hypothetical protein n=1 Tax=Amycolatopsis sp. NPDC004079 TaxID=3154549 RepID=UPI0033AF8CC8
MTEPGQDRITFHVGHDLSGQVVLGNNNITTGGDHRAAAPADLGAVTALLTEIRAALPADLAEPGGAQLDDLEEAITAETPDLSTMERVRDWFSQHVPVLAAAIGRTVLHPVVVRLVGAAGDTLAADFHRRFGS